jgi:hypothetical protein
MRISGFIGALVLASGGCAGSQASRHAEPYALLIPNAETAPDPLPENTTLIEAEPPPDEPSLEPIARKLTQARRLYRDLAFEASLDELRRAQEELEAQLTSERTYGLLDRTLLLRALDELALGRMGQARDAFRQSALLRPDREGLDPAEFSPEVRTEYARARDALRTEAPFAVRVDSEPTGAELLVDGVQAGRTPASVRLHRGRHYLVFRAPGYEAEARIVDVADEQVPSIRVELEPLSGARVAGELAELDAAEFSRLESSTRLGLVPSAGAALPVHIGRQSPGWAAALIERGSGDIRAGASSTIPNLGLAVPELVSTLRDTPQEKPLVRKWWFWTAIGVAVVGTSLGLYFGLRKQPEPQLVIAR